MKTCSYTYCAQQTAQPLSSFHKKAASRDGLDAMCKTCKAGKRKLKYAKDAEKAKAYSRQWRKDNAAHYVTYNKEFKQKHPGLYAEYYNANSAFRKGRLQDATPKWLSEEQQTEIKEIYRNRPAGYAVDHIEPLKGKDVCGLHVPWNLQYLTISENSRKSNRR